MESCVKNGEKMKRIERMKDVFYVMVGEKNTTIYAAEYALCFSNVKCENKPLALIDGDAVHAAIYKMPKLVGSWIGSFVYIRKYKYV